MANYSDIFPLSGGGGSGATNTLLLLRPVDGRIVDLVTGYSPTEMYYISPTNGQNGSVSISDSTFKFNKSIYLYRSILNTLSSHFYDTNFTIECWYQMLEGSIPADFNSLFARGGATGSSSNQTIYFGFSNANVYIGIAEVGGGIKDVGSNAAPVGFNLNQFNHMALVRYNNKLSGYINGVKGVESLTLSNLQDMNSVSVNKMSNGLSIGSGWFPVASGLLNTRCRNGWYEEIRVSNVARYTSNFTPPTAPFEID